MDTLTFNIYSALLGLGGGILLGLGLGWLLMRPRIAELTTRLENAGGAADALKTVFQSLSLEALRKNNEDFLKLAETRFSTLEETAKRERQQQQNAMQTLITPLNQSLEKVTTEATAMEKARTAAYAELQEHLKHLKDDQNRLRAETANLVQALRNTTARGQWGEMQLKRTLEMSGLVEGIHYDTQVSKSATDDARGIRPDVVVKLAGGQSIIIDAKAPIDAYLDSFKEGASAEERSAAMDRHARHVRDHIKALSSKAYWQQFDTPEFVIMFLPGESYFSAAVERDPSLLEMGFDMKVIPASPTSLIAVLRAVAYGWRQEQLAKNARDIAELGQDLYKRLATFGDHMQKIQKGLEGALKGYNGAVGSLERQVLPAARKFRDMQGIGADKDALGGIDQISETTRDLTAPDFTATLLADQSKKESA